MTTPAHTLDKPCRTVEQAAIERLRRVLRETLNHPLTHVSAGPEIAVVSVLRDTAHLDPSTKPADPSDGEG